MVGKATDIETRSCGDPRDAATEAVGSWRTASQSPGTRYQCAHTGRDGGAPERRLSGLLVLALLLVSLIALYEVAQLPDPSSDASRSSSSIRTIRGFYDGLNTYMETGDAGAVAVLLAPGAWSVTPEHGVAGDGSGLLTYLIALRSTHPRLRFSLDHLEAGDDLAIATVRVSGVSGMPNGAWPPASGTWQEFFRVRDGRIVEHWTTAPGSTLLHTLTAPPMQVTLVQPGHLAIAELSFSPSQHNPQVIDGPAFVIVQRGQLTLTGNGSSQILDIETGAAHVPGKSEHVRAGPGQAISIPEYRVLVRNSETESAVALIATLVDDPRQVLETPPGQRHPPTPAINDAALIGAQRSATIGAVTVRPLVFDTRSIPVGMWELEVAWAVLGPDTTLPRTADGAEIAMLMSDTPKGLPRHQVDTGTPTALTNDTSTPVVALVVRLRATA